MAGLGQLQLLDQIFTINRGSTVRWRRASPQAEHLFGIGCNRRGLQSHALQGLKTASGTNQQGNCRLTAVRQQTACSASSRPSHLSFAEKASIAGPYHDSEPLASIQPLEMAFILNSSRALCAQTSVRVHCATTAVTRRAFGSRRVGSLSSRRAPDRMLGHSPLVSGSLQAPASSKYAPPVLPSTPSSSPTRAFTGKLEGKRSRRIYDLCCSWCNLSMRR
jgi:hypothetical protein